MLESTHDGEKFFRFGDDYDPESNGIEGLEILKTSYKYGDTARRAAQRRATTMSPSMNPRGGGHGEYGIFPGKKESVPRGDGGTAQCVCAYHEVSEHRRRPVREPVRHAYKHDPREGGTRRGVYGSVVQALCGKGGGRRSMWTIISGVTMCNHAIYNTLGFMYLT